MNTNPELGQVANRDETFAVAQLPETGGALQYGIKCELDGNARVVNENQLAQL